MTKLRRNAAITIVSAVLVVAIAFAVARRSDDEDGASSGPPTCTLPATSSTTSSTDTSAPTTAPTVTTSSVLTTTAPPDVAPAVAVWQGNQARRVVALTFDCGSDVGTAEEILDILAANHIDATFGMTGSWATAHPELVRRMVDDGHQLVNHSYDHPSFTGRSTGSPPLTRAQRLDQLESAERAIQRAAGVTTQPWFRPPYGDEDASVRADIAIAGYRYELMWTVDSLGWRGLAPDEVVRRCLDRAVPGAIYLFHVGAASTDHLALQEIIDGLRSQGYEFVTASALIEGAARSAGGTG
jgi:peptidoglycan/xylan/chitin deacetylase (PgdA/CDA1 family)